MVTINYPCLKGKLKVLVNKKMRLLADHHLGSPLNDVLRLTSTSTFLGLVVFHEL